MKSLIHFIFLVILTLGLTLATTPSQASTERDSSSEPLYSISAGAKFRSNLYARGATLYDSWQLTPIIYAGFFNHRIQFLVNSLEFRDWVSDQLRLRTKINQLGDNPLYETGGLAKAPSLDRKNTWEWTSTAEIFLLEQGELNIIYAKDLAAHNGDYLEFTLRAYPLNLNPFTDLPLLRPEFLIQLGWGSGNHNAYFYGSNANSSGWNHLAYGIQLTSPARIETIYPVLQFFRYEILGNQNRSGNLVREKQAGYQFNLTVAFHLL